jgi:hypothetical protein
MQRAWSSNSTQATARRPQPAARLLENRVGLMLVFAGSVALVLFLL